MNCFEIISRPIVFNKPIIKVVKELALEGNYYT